MNFFRAKPLKVWSLKVSLK